MGNSGIQTGEASMEAFDRNTVSAIDAKMLDCMTPGYVVEFDPLEAEIVGAFPEDALSEGDAMDSALDLMSAGPKVIGTTAQAWSLTV